MSSAEDTTLLFLVCQHLKMKGLSGAAELLEKHVVQVEAPEVGVSLQDIYETWIKLCPISQQAKQPTAAESNKVVLEGGADETPSEDNMDVNMSLASEQMMEANGNVHIDSTDDDDEEEEARKQPQLIMQVQAETSGLEEADVNQTDATRTPNYDTETSEQATPICAWYSNEQPTESQALLSGDMKAEQDEEAVVKMEVSDGLKQEDYTGAPEDKEAIEDGKKYAAKEQDHKKKGKKRKIHNEDKPSESEVTRRKKVEDINEEKGKNVEEGVSPPEEEEKKNGKKRRRRRRRNKAGQRSQEVQCDAGPAGSNAKTDKQQEASGGTAPQLSSSMKAHPQKKLSRKKRMRLKKSQLGHRQDIPEEASTSKQETYATSEEDAPKSKKIKEDQTLVISVKKDKKKKRTASDEKVENAVGNNEHLPGGPSAHLSEKKKKKKAAQYDETPVINKTSGKKIKKRLKYQKENGRLPVASFQIYTISFSNSSGFVL